MSLRTDAMLKSVRLAADLMKSLSNPHRLSIVCCLVHGELSVSELEELLELRQPTLSQQLAALRESEIVATRREAKQIFYRLKDDRAGQLIAALEQIFCDDETRRVLRSRSSSSLLALRGDPQSTLGSAQFARVHAKKPQAS